MRNIKRGFTLVELLLSIATIGILSAIVAPVLVGTQTKNDLDMAVSAWVSSLRRAAILSRGVDGDTSWGVKAQSGSIVLFRGVSYAARDNSFDEVFSEPATITVSGVNEVVMTKFTGYPETTGTTTFSNFSDSATLTINSRGMVDY